ncbi:hypothetical protein [uncultured Psychrobacter sp.]|uniref:hypothetical protein n=1 Tax=uncultured Psychrobacter sp. TaxID=259303 RepID=UPI002593F966|nr:hypothetical protein [uncultured Psychrobacter sp.]
MDFYLVEALLLLIELQKPSKLLEIKMERYKLSRLLPHNKIIDYITALDEDQDSLTTFMIYNADDYGVYLITLLDEIAKKKHTSFWYVQLGILCTAFLPHLDGANLSALYYYIQAHELDPKDASLLDGILCFGQAPDFILTEEQKKCYAAKLLALEPENEKALAIINS